ncbi:MAG: hypothetical protein VX589_01660 [Myxococcota bacterium]|nr:hypothetical protein [Myxococcota bacterium]
MRRTRLRIVPQDVIFHQTLCQTMSDGTRFDSLDEAYSLLTLGGRVSLGRLHLPKASGVFTEHVEAMSSVAWTTECVLEPVKRALIGKPPESLSTESEAHFCLSHLRRACT